MSENDHSMFRLNQTQCRYFCQCEQKEEGKGNFVRSYITVFETLGTNSMFEMFNLIALRTLCIPYVCIVLPPTANDPFEMQLQTVHPL